LFIKGELGAGSARKGATVAYIFQRNPYERARFHMASVTWRYRFSDQWELEMKSHGSMAQYQEITENKLTGAAELRYRGTLLSDLMLNGSAYYSDPYFSGNRKGVLSLTQSVSKRLSDDMYLSGSFSYNKSEPKSVVYDYNYRSQNSYGSVSVSLPKLVGISSSLLYNYQRESSPSYSRYMEEGATAQNLTMAAHRLGWQWRWQHPAGNHSLYGSLEGGFYRDPVGESRERQGKASLSYAYRWLTTGVTWQQGAYYLYEQVMAQQQNREFTRFTASASVNQRFSKRFHLSSGFNFTHDVYQGNVPSVNINARYFTRPNLSLSLSGYWYKYPFMQNRDMLNVEAGVRYQFRRGQPLSGKKSSLIAKVYYDHNANNRYDQGDEPAEGYLLEMNKQAFVSGRNGEVHYSSLPFGNYSVKPMRAGEWSFNQQEISVDRFKTRVEIPLRQSGTLRGYIRYITGENSVEIVQRNEGFRFVVTSNDEKLKQTVVTDGQGNFITFLPSGDYSITLDQRTLPEHTTCKTMVRYFSIEGGKITKLEPFDIEIKTRKVNVRKFFAQKKE
ncbi:MAG: carboxypeptidase-like regulatory domain-containing protein, partial [Proteiniphilum sp.]